MTLTGRDKARVGSEGVYFQTVLKVYTEAVRVEAEYKTVFVGRATTAQEVVEKVLSKFRIGYKDHRLFYLVMDIRTKTDCTVPPQLPLV